MLDQARLRAGVVAMLPGDLSSSRLRLPSAEKQGRVWSRLLHGNVIDLLERCAKAQNGERRRLKEREVRKLGSGVPWLVGSRKAIGNFTRVMGNDAGVQLCCFVVWIVR